MKNHKSYIFFIRQSVFIAQNYTRILSSILWENILTKIVFIPEYYVRNENIWGDGFLFDFLQKKTIDAWLRQYVIFTGFLFSERIVFEAVVWVYKDIIINPMHNISVFESNNASGMIGIVLFTYLTFFILLSLIFILLFN